MANGRPYTDEERRIICEMYPEHFASEIAQLLGRTKSGIYTQARLMGLKAPREKVVRAGKLSSQHPNVKASQFKKGSTPANKGKKMRPEVYEKCVRTMFKKGHDPVNHRTVGSERVNVEGYVEVADSIIDIYKVQVDALKTAVHMDNVASPGDILVGLGIAGAEEAKMIS